MPSPSSSSSSTGSSAVEPGRQRVAPLEIDEANTDARFYARYRKQTDLREPYRIPKQFLRDTQPFVEPTHPQAPTIVFINAKSGGRAGPQLATRLRQALGVSQVFDLTDVRPDDVLRKMWANFAAEVAVEDAVGGRSGPRAETIQTRLRIIAAGGDGTVAWVLQTVKRLGLEPAPAVSILPLGTGNDLSRSLGWGGAFKASWIGSNDALYKTLKRVADAQPSAVDCWKLDLIAPDESFFTGEGLPYAFTAVPSNEGAARSAFSWNYVSVGMDAQSAYGFHRLRDTRPGLAFSRAANNFWYVFYSCTSGWFCASQPIRRKVRVFRGGGDGGGGDGWSEVPVPASVRAIVVLNLQSYGGGRDIWGRHDTAAKAKGFKAPAPDDGLLEVVAFHSGWTTGCVMSGLVHAERLTQAPAVRLEIHGSGRPGKKRSKAYLQLDGEPWRQAIPAGDGAPPFVLEMTHAGKSHVLRNSPAPAAHPAAASTAAPHADGQPAATAEVAMAGLGAQQEPATVVTKAAAAVGADPGQQGVAAVTMGAVIEPDLSDEQIGGRANEASGSR